jgi:transcriptional regulator with XRE-family HTH domain
MGDEIQQLQYVIKRMKEIRLQKEMSQLELSAKSNMSLSFYASVERGKKQPSVLTLLRIASALDVNPKTFFPETVNGQEEEIKDTIINLIRSL